MLADRACESRSTRLHMALGQKLKSGSEMKPSPADRDSTDTSSPPPNKQQPQKPKKYHVFITTTTSNQPTKFKQVQPTKFNHPTTLPLPPTNHPTPESHHGLPTMASPPGSAPLEAVSVPCPSSTSPRRWPRPPATSHTTRQSPGTPRRPWRCRGMVVPDIGAFQRGMVWLGGSEVDYMLGMSDGHMMVN